jgi:hypothetical protein
MINSPLKRLYTAMLALCVVALPTAAQSPAEFTIGEIKARAGEKEFGFIEVPAAKDEGTRIPVTIVRGTRPGPVLALVAGVHGYEYAPIIALQRLLPRLDPKEISGTIVLVQTLAGESRRRGRLSRAWSCSS